MSVHIEVPEEFDDAEQAADGLERIAKLLRSGYNKGVDPAWDLTGEPEKYDCDFGDCVLENHHNSHEHCGMRPCG